MGGISVLHSIVIAQQLAVNDGLPWGGCLGTGWSLGWG
jgi:hypothetical protein